MSSGNTRLDAALDLMSSAESEGTKAALRDCMGRFGRWCEVNDLEPLPAEEQTVLRFIHIHYPTFSHSYARSIRFAVNRLHIDAGYPPPCGTLTSRYLDCLKRDPNRPLPQKPVAAFRVEDAAKVACQNDDVADPWLDDKRALCALAHRAGVPVPEASHAQLANCDLVDGTFTWVNPSSGQPVRFSGTDGPVDEYLVKVFEGRMKADTADPDRTDLFSDRTRLLASVTAFLKRRQIDLAHVASVATVIPYMDATLERRVRDLAYLLVGIATAGRHASLAEVDLSDVTPTSEGYELVLRRVKNLRPGQTLTKEIAHVGAQGSCSHPACPACALSALLQVWTDAGRTSGPLFATRYRNGAASFKAMTRQNGRLVLLSAWSRLGGDRTEKIATRSLRVGAATSASEAGWRIEEIAAELTNHTSLEICQLYIRRANPWFWQIHLDI